MTLSTAPAIADQVPHVRFNGASKNIQIQWLRAAAALMVMLFHASVYQVSSVFSVFDGRFGTFAVALFFAISGYLMAIAIERQNACLFLAHRIIRIYPIFLIVAALYYVTTRLLHAPVPIDLAALSLVPVDSADYPLTVEWTLVFEVSFYMALFVIGLAGLGKRIPWVALAWLIIIAAFSRHAGDKKYLLTTILLAPENIPFVGGLLIPLFTRFRVPAWSLIILGFGSFLPFCGFLSQNDDLLRWIVGISAVVVVTGIVALSLKSPAFGNNRIGQLFARFGDYSYALYLCHAPVLRFMAHITNAPNLVWLSSVTLAIVLSTLIGKVDLWLYGHFKKIVNGAKPYLRNGMVLIFVAAYFCVGGGVVYAWRQEQAMRPYVNNVAVLLANKSPQDAGLQPSTSMHGLVESLSWENGALTIRGWAFDGERRPTPVGLAFFQNGALLGVISANINRTDVNKFYHTHLMTGYRFTAYTACSINPVTVIAFNKRGLFASSENRQSLQCLH